MTPVAPIATAELDVARRAARSAAAVLRSNFGRDLVFRSKGVADLVSDADTESERVIAAVIREAFPDDAILGEESHRGEVDATRLWIVDPLDGTTNFAHRIPHVAVSIAHYRDGRPECAVVHNPVRDEWFVAARGLGAYHGDAPIHVAACDRLDEALVGTGFYYDRGAMMEATLATLRDLFGRNVHGIRRFGTASLDLCMVATGCLGAFFEYELAPWDFAAGRLIVEEAGGRVTTCRGETLPISSSTVLASNGRLHPTMLEVVRPHIG